MLLTYEAIDTDGRKRRDAIEARDREDAVRQLRSQGLVITHVESTVQAERHALREQPPSRLPLKVVVTFTRQLAMLLRSGSGLVPAIDAIRRQTTNRRHAALFQALIDDLESGTTFTDALRRYPRTFDPVYCAIVAAGEASGMMDEMIDRLAKIVSKRRAMRKKIYGALAYPALLTIMGAKILLVLMFFVLPRFAGMFDTLGVTPPSSTEAMLSIAAFLRGNWPLCLLGAMTAMGGLIAAIFTEAGRVWAANIQLEIPLLGRLRSSLIQGHLFRTLGMLLESGVGVLEALDLARGATANWRFQKMMNDLEEGVTSGGQLSQAFENSGFVSPAVCQAIRTGEDSGQLGASLSFAADTLDETNEELIGVMTKLFEPIILIVLGVLVGGVAILLFLPLFDMTAAVNR